MNKLTYLKYILIGMCLHICTSCSYIQYFQQQTQYSQIQNNISLSRLDKVTEFTSRTPFHKTVEFEFNHSQGDAYALIFHLRESSFSKSIIKHRYLSDLHRDAVRIDGSKKVLTKLNNNLPDAKSVSWRLVARHITADEARDSYHILQEYIRLKIRDL
jgi:hypothetical protein